MFSHVTSIAFNPNAFMLAAGEQSGRVALWDTELGELRQNIEAGKSPVNAVAFNNDGTILATGSALDDGVRLWDTTTLKQIQILKPEGIIYGINHIEFSVDGGILAAGCINGTIQLWDVNTSEHIITFTGYESVRSISFSPDLRSIATVGNNSTVHIWNIFTGETEHTITDFQEYYNCFAVSPDGNTVACNSINGIIHSFDTTTGELQKKVQLHTYRSVRRIAYSPDGKTFVAADHNSATLFEVDTGREIYRSKEHQAAGNCVAISPDSSIIASGGTTSNTVGLWDANTGENLHILTRHEGDVTCLAFSPDSSIIASGSRDKTVHLWDTKTGEKMRVITHSKGIITDLAFSPDGKTLAFVGVAIQLSVYGILHRENLLTLA